MPATYDFRPPLALAAWIALALLGLAIVALIEPSLDNRVSLGAALGTSFGLATAVACCAALGPWPLMRRFPLVMLWLVALCLAWLAHIRSSPGDMGLIWLSLWGQWLAATGVLALLAWRWRVCIGRTTLEEPTLAAGHQFGIGELLALTAIIAVLLGFGRILVPQVPLFSADQFVRDAVPFAVVATTNLVLALPLAIAALLPRRAWLACAVGLAFAALATWSEIQLLPFFGPGRHLDWDVVRMLWLMNACQAAWVLAMMFVLRLGGYALVRRPLIPAARSG